MWGITDSVLTACGRLCCPPLPRLTLLPNTALHKRFGNTTGGGHQPRRCLKLMSGWFMWSRTVQYFHRCLFLFMKKTVYSPTNNDSALYFKHMTTRLEGSVTVRGAWSGRQGAWDREMRSYSAAFFQGRMPVELSGSISINSLSFKWRIVFLLLLQT